MIDPNHHFNVVKLKDRIYSIQENISKIHPAYTNDPLNLYLLVGNNKALLVDTGCGISPLKPIVDQIIMEKELVVVNSHAHWDHVLGNNEFNEVYIHENEAVVVSAPYNLSFFKYARVKHYADRNYIIKPAKSIIKLKDGDIFELGGLNVKIIYSPGHSPGSICLLIDNNLLFTGDVAYYGDQFLSKKPPNPQILNTLSNLMDVCKENNVFELFPSHRKTLCSRTLLSELYEGISNLKNLWHKRKTIDFFHSWIIKDDENDKFRYIIPKF
ncbi:MAG: MBL fold metallo-hydrolase [Candidatus Lokiarchaeota archaeon]|nr:MBL fold metallo-hydrolase [Candidatus Lokiarchaeota archaeon]